MRNHPIGTMRVATAEGTVAPCSRVRPNRRLSAKPSRPRSSELREEINRDLGSPRSAWGAPLALRHRHLHAALQQPEAAQAVRRRSGTRAPDSGKKRWTRGHAIWVSDVFAWRGSPAAWNEELLWVSDATPRAVDPEERKKLRRLGDEPAIATLTAADGETVEVAASSEQASALLGPFARTTDIDPDGRSFRAPGAISGNPGAVSR